MLSAEPPPHLAVLRSIYDSVIVKSLAAKEFFSRPALLDYMVALADAYLTKPW